MKVHGIAVKTAKRGPMRELYGVTISKDTGLSGNYREIDSTSSRQVTVISLPQWQEACSELGIKLDWYNRRAQICLTEHHFSPMDIGKKIVFEDGIILEITGETAPCKRMDEIAPGLKDALANWRGGVTCRVIRGGMIYLNQICFIFTP